MWKMIKEDFVHVKHTFNSLFMTKLAGLCFLASKWKHCFVRITNGFQNNVQSNEMKKIVVWSTDAVTSFEVMDITSGENGQKQNDFRRIPMIDESGFSYC
jgi:hypothetical protein